MGTKKTIDELAWAHFNRHPNDKSNSIVAKMKGTFGWAEAQRALTHMADTILMVDPDHPNAKRWIGMGKRDRILDVM